MTNHNLNLIKLCSACTKQNVAVMIAYDVCLMLAVYTLFDLVDDQVLNARVRLLLSLTTAFLFYCGEYVHGFLNFFEETRNSSKIRTLNFEKKNDSSAPKNVL